MNFITTSATKAIYMVAIIRYLICCIALTISLNALYAQHNATLNKQPRTKFTYKIIDAPQHSFGYDIYAGSKMFVHQPSKPGIPGKEGFALRKDAEKVARLVVQKLQKGIIPPAIAVRELDSLQVKY